jgi:hypothetical protein
VLALTQRELSDDHQRLELGGSTGNRYSNQETGCEVYEFNFSR